MARRIGIGVWIAIVVLAASGCGPTLYRAGPYGHRVAGHFESRGGDLGDFELDATRCHRAGPQGFDVTDGARRRIVRVLVEQVTDENGQAQWRFSVRVANADTGQERMFVPADCDVWSAYAHWDNRDGAAQLDCRTPDGGRFVGYATFAGCS